MKPEIKPARNVMECLDILEFRKQRADRGNDYIATVAYLLAGRIPYRYDVCTNHPSTVGRHAFEVLGNIRHTRSDRPNPASLSP